MSVALILMFYDPKRVGCWRTGIGLVDTMLGMGLDS